MDLDKAFICRLVQESTITQLKESGVSSDMLFDAGPEALDFVVSFFSSHGTMPKIDTIEQSIGKELEEECPEPFDFYIDLVKRRWTGNTLNNAIIKSGEALDKRDVDASLIALKDAIKVIGEKTASVGDAGLVDLRETTQERWDYYQYIKSLGGGIDGIPFPWAAMNDSTRGIHEGEFWIFVARLKTGKSWAEIALANHFFRLGHKVLLVTMEMSLQQIATRLDAVYARLPYGDFKCGLLDHHLEERYAKSLIEWRDERLVPLWVCGKGRLRTVQDLDLLIEEIKPDIVLVDGLYLLRTTGGDKTSKWEKVSTIADELQDLTQRKQIPLIATTQFNRKVTKKKTDAGSEDIGFSLELAQNCHGLIAMFQTDDLRARKEMLIKLIEIREGEPINLFLNWDFSTMDFSQKSVATNDQLNTTDDDDDEGPIKY